MDTKNTANAQVAFEGDATKRKRCLDLEIRNWRSAMQTREVTTVPRNAHGYEVERVALPIRDLDRAPLVRHACRSAAD